MSERVKCWVGNLDGNRTGLVVAANQREAAKAAGTGITDFRNYWNAVTGKWPIFGASLRTLYTKPYDSDEPFVQGRCEIKRRERT